MRIRASIAVAMAVFGGAAALAPGEAHAQNVTLPFVERDDNWDTVSNVMMGMGVASVALMPRIYYASPDATVGWKARWHVSSLAPTMSMVGLTLLVDGPIRDAIKAPRPGCTVDQTIASLPASGCESYGMMSTQAFASWGAFGGGLGVFLVDTLKYSDSEFHAGSFIGNVAVPFTTALIGSIARNTVGAGTDPGGEHESPEQIVAGAVPGFVIGGVLGLVYSFAQEPNCGYGDTLFCW